MAFPLIAWVRARSWALNCLDNVERMARMAHREEYPPATTLRALHIHVPPNLDHAQQYILREVPQEVWSHPLLPWSVNYHAPTATLQFTRDMPDHASAPSAAADADDADVTVAADVTVTIHLRLFDDPTTHSRCVYAGLYDDKGKRWSDQCLMLYDPNQEFQNIGYAPGRCPDRVDTPVGGGPPTCGTD